MSLNRSVWPKPIAKPVCAAQWSTATPSISASFEAWESNGTIPIDRGKLPFTAKMLTSSTLVGEENRTLLRCAPVLSGMAGKSTKILSIASDWMGLSFGNERLCVAVRKTGIPCQFGLREPPSTRKPVPAHRVPPARRTGRVNLPIASL